jgi:putative transposase
VNLHQGRHSTYSLHYHIVFVTKYRKPILGRAHLDRLRTVFQELADEAHATLAEFNGEGDHVHLLLQTTPNTPSIAKLVNNLKAVSSRRLRREFCDIAGAYSKPVVWSRSYFAGTCGGAPLEVIAEYIRNQGG